LKNISNQKVILLNPLETHKIIDPQDIPEIIFPVPPKMNDKNLLLYFVMIVE